MDVIPVIDLRDATVVHARLGRRDEYRPIATRLSPSSDPVAVARGFLAIHPFATLYVADLDAIAGRGDNRATVARLKAAFPHVALWVDNGIARLDDAAQWLASGLGALVLGSETQSDAALVRRFARDDRVVLSLDFRGAAFAGPPELLADAASWPDRVIVMTLARVGSGMGPDMETLAAVRKAGAHSMIYAAGGVRGAADLIALSRAGIAGALVASCLHDGRLTGDDIAGLTAAARRSVG